MAQVNGQLLRHCLAERIGLPVDVADQRIHESLLIANGVYCGRKFSLDGYTLTWFIEENQVKFFCPQGRLLVVCDSAAFVTQAPNRQAA